MKCCICRNEIDRQYTVDGILLWDKGHNAHPVKEGRCCTLCNSTVVVPTRIKIEKQLLKECLEGKQ